MVESEIYTALVSVDNILAASQTDPIRNQLFIFSPMRLFILIAWVYACFYSISFIEYHPLVPRRLKTTLNTAALFVGPAIWFVLFCSYIVYRIQKGDLDISTILSDAFGHMFKREEQADSGASIELLDSSGRNFSELYGGQLKKKRQNRQVQDMTESIILDAICGRASDILIDPKDTDSYSVRFRIDGFLRNVDQLESEKAVAIINSIKAISGMDIAEKRRPQDGAFLAKVPKGSIHFRVASAGVLGGEKLSIRVLNQLEGLMKLQDIGLSKDDYSKVLNAVHQSAGMIVICGPTGSGKTTSLYAMLSSIDVHSRNIVTVEDPIEYVLPNISQIEVNTKANITFANTLRSILRQDPDVICVGEIRDPETAQMAIQSSQTGHLVLATLHASSNMAALVRLIDLQIKPLLIASGLSIIISQRLVRRLCKDCKSPATLSETQIDRFKRKNVDMNKIMAARGCKKCGFTGYFGRIGIHDVMHLDDEIKARLANNELSLGDLKKEGDEKGKNTLLKRGMKCVLEGETTLEEVKRVVSNLG